MKRFYKDVAVEEAEGGFRVTLDGRPIRTQGGAAQVVPTRALAEALAEEWRAQGDEIDPGASSCATRPISQSTRSGATRGGVARLLPYAETDTLCYRADPDEPLYRRQQALWEPLVQAPRPSWPAPRTDQRHRPPPAAAGTPRPAARYSG